MEQKKLESFKKWFTDYVAGFYGTDKFINDHIKLKEVHTQKVCEESKFIADSISLDTNKKRLAEIIALFHDVGRFEQFAKYRTYKDAQSVNHSLLGVKILRDKKVLEGLDKSEQSLIEKVVQLHGVAKLNSDLPEQVMLFLKLIRDADKLDILRVMLMYFNAYKANPKEYQYEMEFPDVPEYSNNVLKSILRGEPVDYSSLQTFNDLKLLLLGWVYDINFPVTFKMIKERHLLEQIIDFMPASKEIDEVKKRVLDYVDSKIKS